MTLSELLRFIFDVPDPNEWIRERDRPNPLPYPDPNWPPYPRQIPQPWPEEPRGPYQWNGPQRLLKRPQWDHSPRPEPEGDMLYAGLLQEAKSPSLLKMLLSIVQDAGKAVVEGVETAAKAAPSALLQAALSQATGNNSDNTSRATATRRSPVDLAHYLQETAPALAAHIRREQVREHMEQAFGRELIQNYLQQKELETLSQQKLALRGLPQFSQEQPSGLSQFDTALRRDRTNDAALFARAEQQVDPALSYADPRFTDSGAPFYDAGLLDREREAARARRAEQQAAQRQEALYQAQLNALKMGQMQGNPYFQEDGKPLHGSVKKQAQALTPRQMWDELKRVFLYNRAHLDKPVEYSVKFKVTIQAWNCMYQAELQRRVVLNTLKHNFVPPGNAAGEFDRKMKKQAEQQKKQREQAKAYHQQNVQKLHKYALEIKKLVDTGKIDSVEGFKRIAKRAAELSKNDTQRFTKYMDHIFIGQEAQAPFIGGGNLPRVLLGDKGYHPDYQDHSPEQARHFWGFVNYGYQFGPLGGEVANIIHEGPEPLVLNLAGNNQAGGSSEDFALSSTAIDAGFKLRTHQLTPNGFVKELDTILRTRDYGKLKITPIK